MRRLFVAFLFLALVIPAFAQPSSGALCQSPSGQWIPLLASATGTVYPGTPPGTSLYGSSNGGVAWYPLQCDATGKLLGGGGGLVPASTPAFSPVAGTYAGVQSVTASCTYGTVECNITGSAPVLGSCSSISVASNETINAGCFGLGYTPTLASAAYVINGIRSSNIATDLGTSTVTLTVPAGAQVGDFAVIVSGGACGVDGGTVTLSPWTAVQVSSGGFWNGGFYYTHLTSGIISGGATIHYGCAGYGIGSMIDFIGATNGYVTSNSAQSGSGTDVSLAAPILSGASAGQVVIWVASNRADGVNTVSRGTQLQTATESGQASLSVYGETLAGGFSTAVTYDFPGLYNPSGNYAGYLVVAP